MTDKEFRRLSRPELIDIIFELQQQLEQHKSEIQQLKQAVEKKELDISNAGSLAEAVVSINGVMEAAQAAADQYILSVKAANENAEKTLAAAKAEAVRIVCDAQRRGMLRVHRFHVREGRHDRDRGQGSPGEHRARVHPHRP